MQGPDQTLLPIADEVLPPRFVEGLHHQPPESSHPGCTLNDAVDLAVFLNRTGRQPEQVQDFYRANMAVNKRCFILFLLIPIKRYCYFLLFAGPASRAFFFTGPLFCRAAMLWRRAGMPAPGAASDLSRFSDQSIFSPQRVTMAAISARVAVPWGYSCPLYPRSSV